MRLVVSAAACAAVLLAGPVSAGLNLTYLVPAYAPCASPAGVCSPPVLESSFTFERAAIRSSRAPFTGPGKVGAIVELTGVRDASGQLVDTDPGDQSDDFLVVIPASNVTLLSGSLVGTLTPSLAGGPITYRLDLKKGKGKLRIVTPPETPESGFIAETLGTPVILDNQGKRFAVSGVRARP
jgi:hypothetical protein